MQTQLQELGPHGMFADLGPNLQGQAAALANMPGEAQQTIRGALDARNAGANARIGAAVDQNLGPNVVPSEIISGIDANQRTVGNAYNPVMAAARRVDTEPLANALDANTANLRGPAQRAVQQVRGYLNIPGTDTLDPNPQALLATRQAIDGLLSDETNPQVIRQLTIARQSVDDTLANAAPGIKDVDAQFAELARQREAIQRGQTVLDSGRTAPRPAELADEVAQGALPQGTQIGPSAVPFRMSQGARAEVDRILGNNANDVARLNTLIKSEGDWNRSRLASLFGQDRADQLFNVLDNERTFAGTRNFATGNSATAGRTEAIRELGGGPQTFNMRDAYAAGGILGALRSAGVKIGGKIGASILAGRNQATNAALADILASNRGAVVQALARAPAQTPRLADPIVRALMLGSATAGSR
jgi:hypothetical protein